MAFGLQLRRRELGLTQATRSRRASWKPHESSPSTNYLDRKPKALSGGQRQRVAVGRAIVRNPKAFLFDEPLSNLDAKLRVETRAEIKKLHLRLKTTTIYVTHDQEEAMTLGDRIVVMKDGIIQQCAPPLEVYDRPVNRFVASFVGTPPMNFLTGKILRRTRWQNMVYLRQPADRPAPAHGRSRRPPRRQGIDPGRAPGRPFSGQPAMESKFAWHETF